MSIEYKECDGGFEVKVPYDLKDIFKSVFKTAKWQNGSKTWFVSGKTAEKRLKGLVENTEGAVQKFEEAKQKNDEAELKDKELRDINEKIEAVTRSLNCQTKFIGDLDNLEKILSEKLALLAESEEKLEAGKAEVEQKEAEVEQKEAEVEQKEAEVQSKLDAIDQKLSGVLDYGEIEKAQRKMIYGRENFRREIWNEGVSIIDKQRNRLKEVGLQSYQLNVLSGDNYNRAGRNDRDDPRLVDVSKKRILSRISKIEE